MTVSLILLSVETAMKKILCLIHCVPREWPAVHQAICELWRPSAQGCQNSLASIPFIANFPPKKYIFSGLNVCVRTQRVSWGRFLGQYGDLRSVGGCQSPAADTVRRTFLTAASLMVYHAETGWNRLGVIFTQFTGSNGHILPTTLCRVSLQWASDPACLVIHVFGL